MIFENVVLKNIVNFAGRHMKSECSSRRPLVYLEFPVVALHRCSYEKVLWKFAANLQEGVYTNGCSPVNLLHIFRTSFPKNSSGGLLLSLVNFPLWNQYTLSKYPGGHLILRRGLKLNPKNWARKNNNNNKTSLETHVFHRGAKQKFPEYLSESFPLPIMFKKGKDSIKGISHISHMSLPYLSSKSSMFICFVVRVLRVAAVT